ncbi:MAG: prepilin peptidase [Arenibacterium sp.]
MPAFLLPVLALVAFFDLKLLRIPDKLTVIALIGFVPIAATLPVEELILRLLTAAAVFAIGFCLFALRLFGGGDVKFLPVLLLFIPTAELATFCYCLSASILLAIATVSVARNKAVGAFRGWAFLTGSRSLPLGVSFAYAGLLSWMISIA